MTTKPLADIRIIQEQTRSSSSAGIYYDSGISIPNIYASESDTIRGTIQLTYDPLPNEILSLLQEEANLYLFYELTPSTLHKLNLSLKGLLCKLVKEQRLYRDLSGSWCWYEPDPRGVANAPKND